MSQNGNILGTLLAAATTFGAKGAGMLLGFVVQLIIANRLGANEAGVFFYGANALLLLTVFAGFGMEMSLLRRVATARQRSAPDDARAALGTAVLVGLAGAILVAVLGGTALMASLASALGPSANPQVLSLTLATVPAQLFVFLSAEFHRGNEHIARSQLIRFTVIPSIFLVSWTVVQPTTAVYSMALFTLAAWISAAGVLFFSLPRFHLFHRPAAVHGAVRTLTNALPLYITALSAAVIAAAPTIAAALWCTSADVARFHIALQLTSLIAVIQLSFNAVVAPKIVHYDISGQHRELASYVRRVTVLAISLAALPIGVLLVAPGTILSLFGEGFREADNLVRIMAVGQWMSIIAGPVGYMLIMTGHEKTMRNATIGATVSVILALGLVVPTAGTTGAAIVQTAALAGRNILMAFLVWKFLNIVTVPILPQPQIPNDTTSADTTNE